MQSHYNFSEKSGRYLGYSLKTIMVDIYKNGCIQCIGNGNIWIFLP